MKGKLYKTPNFDDDVKDWISGFKKVKILNWACKLNDIHCIKEALISFDTWKDGSNPYVI